ncbi:MAG: two-component regulator propeller domain-containing protein [Rikenellaceae bacterium]
MTKLYFRLLLLILTLSYSTIIKASEPTAIDYNISKLPDIPQNDINDICQDSRGFIWIGTLDGLHRFDGYSYSSYKTSENVNTINSNLISSIDEDRLGNIWIATYDKGICKLNTKNNEITDYLDIITHTDGSPIYNINKIHIDDQDVLWVVSDNNIFRVMFDQSLEQMTKIELILTTNSEAHAVYSSTNNQLWVAASNQLVHIANPYDTTENITQQLTSYDIHVQDICESDSELIAVGGELYTLQKDTEGNISSTSSLYAHPNIKGSCIICDNHRIWVGGKNGVVCYDKTANTWVKNHSFNGDFRSLGLGSNSVFSMLSTDNSNIWIGTRGGGINVIDLKSKPFKHYKHTSTPRSISNNMVTAIFQDSYGQVWIGTGEDGVNVLSDPTTQDFDSNFTHLSVNPKGATDGVYCVNEMFTPASKERESIIWLCTNYYAGLVGIDPHTHKIIHSLNRVGYAYTTEVCDSTLWVGTYRSGLWRFKFNQRGEVLSSDNFMPNDYEGSVSSNIIRHILKDSKGNLWIGTDKGLSRLSPEEAEKPHPVFEDYSRIVSNERYGFDYNLQILEDSTGKIWIGTMGNGLLYYNPKDDTKEISFKRLTTEDNLPNNTIKSIVEDDKGCLWISTNNGICRLNMTNFTTVNYDVDDGLQANEFTEICGTKLKDGRVMMGGVNGFNIFIPKEIKPDYTPLRLFISNLYVNNTLIKAKQKFNGRVLIKNNIDFSNQIKLDHDENNLSFNFIGIHYNSPGKNRYEYKLEGFDTEWIQTSSNIRTATYTNIPPGDYLFKVNCYNIENPDNIQRADLKIRIKQPFYHTRVAYLIYAILISFIVFALLRIKENKDKEKHKLLVAEMEKKQVEELAQVRHEFFTNISHEFKTPLTLIKGYSDRLLSNPNANLDDRVKNYNMIKWNVFVLMRLISQLMDFRRLDQNKMNLKFSKVEINKFITSIYEPFTSWTEQKNIQFTFDQANTAIETTLDTNKMEIVLFNIISNAIKYTPESGKINIAITTQPSHYVISISDTGIGIPEKDQDRIFERFFQSSDKKRIKAGGSGIGLAHAKSLVEKMNGNISFTSKVDEGTTFNINMPIDNEEATVENGNESYVFEYINIEHKKLLHLNQTQTTNSSPSKKSVLLVEDNKDLSEFIFSDLSDDYNVAIAEDGKIGYEMAQSEYPDIIVSDVMMPNMDGLEMCHCIKTDEQTSHIPIILLTAKSSEEAKIEGYNNKADAYLTKPFSSKLLKERIRAILSNRESLQTKFQKEIKINPMIIANSEVDVIFMDKVLKLIEDNLSDPDYNIEKIAQDYGVSRSFLTRKIKAITGESALKFQRSIRLKHAAQHLTHSNLTISEIAWKIGYNDIDTFRNRFKEQFGSNPSEYRQQNKQSEAEE